MPPVSPFANVLPKVDPNEERPLPSAQVIDLPNPLGPQTTMDGDASVTEQPDGGAVVDFNPSSSKKPASNKFDRNLALEMDDSELANIAEELLQGIDNDEQSRADQLTMIANGMKLLGLVLEEGSGGIGESSAPMEGMSVVRHPLLLDACLMFQAIARGEMLPASGPVKVRDDRTHKPAALQPPGMGHNGGPPLGPMAAPPVPIPPGLTPPAPANGGMNAGPLPPSPNAGGPASPFAAHPTPPNAPPGPPPAAGLGPPGPAAPMPMPPMPPPAPPEEDRDELAEALEKDFNHYLTATATEYYPDSDAMHFRAGFAGKGVKKVYNCPLRRRPVIESIQIEDFIVSNSLTDLANAGRKTHRSMMRPSVLKRMQILGVYRDTPITQPTQATAPSEVKQQKAAIAGVTVNVQDPKDADHEMLECYCELDLKAFAPKKFKDKGLPLPYRVTIERDSRKVLEVRRNWDEKDEQALAKEFFVDYTYVPAFGFLGIGLLHILGNTTKTLTAAWREFIDSGMFANFPGFLYAKGAGRQLTNQMRVPPGGGLGLDVGLQDIRSAVMALPYKDLGPAFTAFIQQVQQYGQQLGGTANTNTAEGKQNAPVGTTLALIEMQTKPVGAVMKRFHDSQAREFQLLKMRFKEDPEAFWRFNPRPAQPWQKEQFVKALEDYDFVPVSDPNNPTNMHRMAKSEWVAQKAAAAPQYFDIKKTIAFSANLAQIDGIEDLLIDPAPQGQDPAAQGKMADVAAKHAKIQSDEQIKQTEQQGKLQLQQMEMADRQAERDNRLKVVMAEQATERLRLASTLAIHSDQANAAKEALTLKIGSDHILGHDERMHAAVGDERQRLHDQSQADIQRQHEKEMAAQAAAQQPQEPTQ